MRMTLPIGLPRTMPLGRARFYSVAAIAALLQRSPTHVLARLEALGAEPIDLNDCPHYPAAVVDQLCEPQADEGGK